MRSFDRRADLSSARILTTRLLDRDDDAPAESSRDAANCRGSCNGVKGASVPEANEMETIRGVAKSATDLAGVALRDETALLGSLVKGRSGVDSTDERTRGVREAAIVRFRMLR